MSEKRVCSASRSFAPLIGLFAAPNRPRNAPNSKIPLRKPLFQADSMRLWRIHSAKGAFTLSIDPKLFPGRQTCHLGSALEPLQWSFWERRLNQE